MEQANSTREEMLAIAADHLQSALKLLDSVGAPAQIGAQVDLALHQIHSELLGASIPASDHNSTVRH